MRRSIISLNIILIIKYNRRIFFESLKRRSEQNWNKLRV